MKKALLPICLLMFLTPQGQYKKPYFNSLTLENGLPEGVIESSLQDRLGYLWLGTQNGLVRYDGYATKLYPMPGDDGKPLIAPTISYLFEDSDGTIWAAVNNEGIYFYNRQADAFVKAGIARARSYALKQDNLLLTFEGTRKGTYWLLGIDDNKNMVQLDLYDTTNNTVKQFTRVAIKTIYLFFVIAQAAWIGMARVMYWPAATACLAYTTPKPNCLKFV